MVLTRATWCNIPEDTILHSHSHENLKSYIVFPYGEATYRHIQQLETLQEVLTRATRRNIPEDAILHSHRHENLKSYNNNNVCWPVALAQSV
jgi:hypothetical protein